jgi:ArsR family transcriptional regulator, arsenate/arsenite/antimonite-responsive transcriptional repressor
MELEASVQILSALAHASRLTVFRLLVQAGEGGMPAGEIARLTGIVPSTLSTHLGVLTQAGLIGARRDGRLIIYTADYARMRELLGFLLEDCCGGAPEVCAPLAEIAARAACCAAG